MKSDSFKILPSFISNSERSMIYMAVSMLLEAKTVTDKESEYNELKDIFQFIIDNAYKDNNGVNNKEGIQKVIKTLSIDKNIADTFKDVFGANVRDLEYVCLKAEGIPLYKRLDMAAKIINENESRKRK